MATFKIERSEWNRMFLTGIHLVNTLRDVNIHYLARANKYYEILEPGNLSGELKSFSIGFPVIVKNKEEKWSLNNKEVKYHIYIWRKFK